MSRQKQIELMMKEFIHKQVPGGGEGSKSNKVSGIQLPMIKNNMINGVGIDGSDQKYKFSGVKSTNQSRIQLDKSLLPSTSPEKYYLNSSIGEDGAEFRNTKSVLASSIDHSDTVREHTSQIPVNLKFDGSNKKSPRRNVAEKNAKRSQSQMASTKKKHNQTINLKANFQLIDDKFRKRGQMGTLANNKEKINEDNIEQVDSKRHFNETFNPNRKHQMNSISQDDISIPVITAQNGESDKAENKNLSNSVSKYRSLNKNESNNESENKRKVFQKMITSDYVPGPGQYNVSSSFIQTDRGKISHKRHLSHNNTNPSNNDSSTSRDYGIDQIMSVYNTSKMGQGSEGKFGLSFENVKKQYFREYDVELYGRHSPGPGAYSPSAKNFIDEKHEQKTMTKEKRVCPIVPKQQQQTQASPFSYNQQLSSFNAHKNFNNYFGTRAERKVDARLFGQQHAYVVQKGLY